MGSSESPNQVLKIAMDIGVNNQVEQPNVTGVLFSSAQREHA